MFFFFKVVENQQVIESFRVLAMEIVRQASGYLVV